MIDDLIPRAKVEELSRQVHALLNLHAERSATQAKLLRWIREKLDIDVQRYGMRGHETHAERQRIVDQNRRDKVLAKVYIDWLATQLEDASPSVPLTTSNEGELPCTEE